MPDGKQGSSADTAVRGIDPRRSLAARLAWLIIALAVTFAAGAALWVGRIARANVLEQHARRLALETDQLSFDLGQALMARLEAIEGVERVLEASSPADGNEARGVRLFDELRAAYPELDWILWASAEGEVLRSAVAAPVTATPGGLPAGALPAGALPAGARIAPASWFKAALEAPWIGNLGLGSNSGLSTIPSRDLGDLAVPVRDSHGVLLGVIAARLSWPRAAQHPERLTDEPERYGPTEACVLDAAGIVQLGPAPLIGHPWRGMPIEGAVQLEPAATSRADSTRPRFERLPDGRRVLVAIEPLEVGAHLAERGWRVLLSEPIGRVYQRANILAYQILWAALALGGATALLGVLGTRHLMRRLDRLTRSVAALGPDAQSRIEIPTGRDEVGELARAFDHILGELQREREELKRLSSELERRVAVRTAEVERLAEESRYAAIVRERLQIARDLHDTLAHSMMALLSEIRFLRRLQARDPQAVPEELEHAEQVAREGLQEARAAIAQMRGHAVRETGLGPAIARELERFRDRTGLPAVLDADPQSARFGDERADVLLRMVQEALRNAERHARATEVRVTLRTIEGARLQVQIEDNGVGFDPSAPHPGHFGLVGLSEQSALIGARLEIDSGAERGTRITLTVPLSPIPFGP
jgi:signal transduction histidine kinase